jgi:23S rRNA pseudouridine2457 synthase
MYIAFNKPYAVLTQFTQPEGSAKETLSAFDFPPDVYSIGRLDYDSEGLLLLSDDTALNAALLQPSRGHTRSYLVQVENIPTEEALEKLRRGVMVEGRRTLPSDAELLPAEPDLPPRPVPVRFR